MSEVLRKQLGPSWERRLAKSSSMEAMSVTLVGELHEDRLGELVPCLPVLSLIFKHVLRLIIHILILGQIVPPTLVEMAIGREC